MNPLVLVGIGVGLFLLFGATKPKATYTREQFKQALLPIAQNIEGTYAYPASFTVTQASLESDDGNSELTQIANNLFGFTADASYPRKVLMSTKEYIIGKGWVRMSRLFRGYGSWEESAIDYIRLIMTADRYKDVVAKAAAGDVNGWADALDRSGYATGPVGEYAAELKARYKSLKW